MREKSRSDLEDHQDRPEQLTVLALELPQPRLLRRRLPTAESYAVDISPSHPASVSVSGVIPNFEPIELIVAHCDEWSRSCSSTIAETARYTDLRWVSAWSCHRSILSRIRASSSPGAVQT